MLRSALYEAANNLARAGQATLRAPGMGQGGSPRPGRKRARVASPASSPSCFTSFGSRKTSFCWHDSAEHNDRRPKPDDHAVLSCFEHVGDIGTSMTFLA